MTDQATDDPIIKRSELPGILKVHTDTIRRAIKDKKIPAPDFSLREANTYVLCGFHSAFQTDANTDANKKARQPQRAGGRMAGALRASQETAARLLGCLFGC